MRQRSEKSFLGWLVGCIGAVGLWGSAAHAQVPITTLESAYTQDFNTLASSATSSTVPTGWAFLESGTGANATYSAGTGSGTAGDTYSFGAASASDRGFGSLLSGTVVPTLGASFTNNTGSTITSLTISYTGEQWRLGSTAREDRLEFQYSLDATSLATGTATWTAVSQLNFVAPVSTAPTGALDGNAEANKRSVSYELAVSIAPGTTFWIRWNDFNASGADDGLAIDDFSLTAHGGSNTTVSFLFEKTVDPVIASHQSPGDDLEYLVSFDVTAASQSDASNVVITDTLPAGLTALPDNFQIATDAGTFPLTTADDGDDGEIVGGVVTVRVGTIAKGKSVLLSFRARIDARESAGTLNNVAGATFASSTGTAYVESSDQASINVTASLGTVEMLAFFDTNGNGTQEVGEPGLSGWSILLDTDALLVTDTDGLATFTRLAAGPVDYIVDDPAAQGTWHYTDAGTVVAVGGQTIRVSIPVTCTCSDGFDGDLCTVNHTCFAGSCSAGSAANCDDGNTCTTDACVPATGCGHVNNTVACNDNNASTKNDTCNGGGACVGTPYSCSATQCEQSSVPNGVDCTIVNKPNTATCDDGSVSTNNDKCNGSGACVGTPYTCTPSQCELTSTANGTDCTVTFKSNTATCDDGNLSTNNDKCNGAGTCAGTPYTCTPSNACEASVPNGVGCTVSPIGNGGSCNDGNSGTRNDTCQNGTCAGTSYACTPTQCEQTSVPNGVDCTVTYKANTATCDDGLTNTNNDKCNGSGLCVGTPYTCVPNQCQTSSVVNGTDCTIVNKPVNTVCSDGSDSTRNDVCNGSGACAGTPYTCTPTQCEQSSTPNGTDCTIAYKPSTATCDDGNVSTNNDKCNGAGTCSGTPYTCTPSQCEATSTPNGTGCTATFKPNTATCNDANTSTKDDKCDGAGACAGTPFTCTPTQCQASATPNGTDCTVVNKPNTATCDDGSASTNNDKCNGSGVCAGTSYTCTPTQCQASSTPNGTDCTVVNKPNTATCDDTNTGTKDDKCDGAGACQGTAYTCTAANACQTSTPNGTSCTVTPIGNGDPCNDGAATTRDDVCWEGVCQGTTYACAPKSCEATSVANGVDCTVTYLPADTACDDGVAATRLDKCDGAGACAGTSYTCTPTQCQSASVPNGDSCVVTNAVSGTVCDDGDPCTKEDGCDGNGGCVGAAVSCDDGQVCSRPGGCAPTHCESCEGDGDCGANSACLGTDDGDRCLLACAGDEDCASGQVCREHSNGTKRCFDLEGTCVAPPEVADEGPEPNPEVEPEVVEETDTTTGDTSTGDTTEPDTSTGDTSGDTTDTRDTTDAGTDTGKVVTGGGGCAGGGAASVPMVLGALVSFIVLWRRRPRK